MVVAGYAGSSGARLATLWAAHEAHNRRHTLVVVYGAGWPALPEPPSAPPMWPTPLGTATDPAALEYAESRLDAISGECRRLWPNLHVRTQSIFGHPADSLCQAAAGAQLLVVGPPVANWPRRTLFGSTAAQLVHGCDRPMVVVRFVSGHEPHTAPAGGGRVVIGIGESSVHATRFAYDYAARHACELVAVRAWPDPSRVTTPGSPGEVRRDWHTEWARAEWLLAQLLEGHAAQYPHVRVRRVVTRDRPARALCRHANGAALLVVGRHNRVGGQTATLGSTSATLIHRSPCPIAILREHAPATA